MPRGDGTGPTGAGPMTGRSAGYCAGFNAPGFATGGGFGRGMGMGMGMGRGFRNRWFTPQTPIQPASPQDKTDQIIALKAQMDRIGKQIEAMEKTA